MIWLPRVFILKILPLITSNSLYYFLFCQIRKVIIVQMTGVLFKYMNHCKILHTGYYIVSLSKVLYQENVIFRSIVLLIHICKVLRNGWHTNSRQDWMYLKDSISFSILIFYFYCCCHCFVVKRDMKFKCNDITLCWCVGCVYWSSMLLCKI